MATVTHTVQTGDNISAIAKRYNVPTSAVSGFRSNDPNVIFPGEVLQINAPNAPVAPSNLSPDGKALVPPKTPPQAPVAPVQPNPAPQAPVAPATPPAQPVAPSQPVQQPKQPVQPSAPVVPAGWDTETYANFKKANPNLEPTPEDTARMLAADPNNPNLDKLLQDLSSNDPATASKVLELLGNTGADNIFSKFGVSADALQNGFQTSPATTLSDLVKQVMDTLGLPDIRANINDISKEIESLANERDDKIQKINDNPFISAGTKKQQIDRIDSQYELKIKNRQDRLTLLQSSYSDARQEAQFAATTAINLYDKNRNFTEDHIQKALDRAEKVAEAQAQLGPLTSENVGGFIVLRDSSGKVVSSRVASSGGVTTFTNSQVNTGANNASLDSSTFKSLLPEVQNFYIHLTKSNKDDLNTLESDVKNGTLSPTDAKSTIDSLSVAQPVKDYLNQKIDSIVPTKTKSEGLLPDIWNSISLWLSKL